MTKKILFPLFILFFSCNSPAPEKSAAKPKSVSKPAPAVVKPAPNPWVVRNYVNSNGETSDRKYGRFDADGTFSDKTVTNGYLHAVILLNKENAGILLSVNNRSNPAKKFEEPVTITMKNSAGNELELSSSRAWNKSGGILIEQNNNDYSRFRIFMQQAKGTVNVNVRGDSSSVYSFNIDATGFGDALGQL